MVKLFSRILIIACLSSAESTEVRKFPAALNTADFHTLVEQNSVIVDKTLFIQEFLQSSSQTVLITYPHSWGKSINLNMIDRFLRIETDAHGGEISFENRSSTRIFFNHPTLKFKIADPEVKVVMRDGNRTVEYDPRDLAGTIPTVFLNLSSLTGANLLQILESVKLRISGAFKSHEYMRYVLRNILSNTTVDRKKKDVAENYLRLFDKYLHGRDVTNDEIHESLVFLSNLLWIHHKKQVFIFIDGHDSFINNLLAESLEYEEFACSDFIKKFIQNTLIFNKYRGKALLTGSLLSRGTSLKLSGLRNVVEVNCLSDSNFTKYFGFLEGEVADLLEARNLRTKKLDVKRWYSYNIGRRTVYNPWSIMDYLTHLDTIPCWANIITEEFAAKFVFPRIVERELYNLIANDTLIANIKDDITIEDIICLMKTPTDSNRQRSKCDHQVKEAFTFLLLTGYLTPAAVDHHFQNTIKVRLPNSEIFVTMRRMMRRYVGKHHNLIDPYALWLAESFHKLFLLPDNDLVYEQVENSLELALIQMNPARLNKEVIQSAVGFATATRIPYTRVDLDKFLGVFKEVTEKNGVAEEHIIRRKVDVLVIFEKRVGAIIELKCNSNTSAMVEQMYGTNYTIGFEDPEYNSIEEILLIAINARRRTRNNLKRIRFKMRIKILKKRKIWKKFVYRLVSVE